MLKVNKKDINKLLADWSKQFSIYIPSDNSGMTRMALWDGKDISLDWYRNTAVPSKELFLPAMEEIFHFHKNQTGYHLELPPTDEKKVLIFGIRPCDARALSIIDAPFKDAYQDNYYLARRQKTVLVGLGCVRPYDSCFCTSLGISPVESGEVDLMLNDVGDELFIEKITGKGKELAISTAIEANPADETRVREAKETARKKIVKNLSIKDIGKRLLSSFENKEFWEKAAAKCTSCGICTFLCPTCYCFDINDEATKKEGARFRSWDSCSFPLYTRMPMENPREEKWQRVRQKVSHKYAFYPRLFDAVACTGCGRCIRQCPVNWDITQTLASLPESVTSEK